MIQGAIELIKKKGLQAVFAAGAYFADAVRLLGKIDVLMGRGPAA